MLRTNLKLPMSLKRQLVYCHNKPETSDVPKVVLMTLCLHYPARSLYILFRRIKPHTTRSLPAKPGARGQKPNFD